MSVVTSTTPDCSRYNPLQFSAVCALKISVMYLGRQHRAKALHFSLLAR
jgi:hypothetical protein